LIDSRLSPQKSDIDFVNQLAVWKVPFALVFTKSDKITQRDSARNVNSFLNQLKETWEVLPHHFITSTVKRLGRKDILDYIKELNVVVKNSAAK
jgi:GTP-binding protein